MFVFYTKGFRGFSSFDPDTGDAKLWRDDRNFELQ